MLNEIVAKLIGELVQSKKVLIGVASQIDRLLLTTIFKCLPSKSPDPNSVACVCLEGTGNFGSRALVESAIANLPSSAFFTSADSALFQEIGLPKSRFKVISKIYPSLSLSHLRSLVDLVQMIRKNQNIYVVSADNLDGAWSDALSGILWNSAIVASANGRKATMLGGSWNQTPTNFAIKSLRKASQVGVRIFARDSDSYKRMIAVANKNVHQAADIVFAMDALYKEQTSENLEKSKLDYAVLCGNPGFTIEPATYSVELLRPVLQELSRFGKIMLTATVVRPGQNDLQQLERIYDHFKSEFNLVLVGTIPNPIEMRELLAKAELLVTFRMHPAIIAFSERVPVVMFDYQDKMRGLAKDLGVEEYCISNANWSDSGALAVRSVVANKTKIVRQLKIRIPQQIHSAMLNFQITTLDQ